MADPTAPVPERVELRQLLFREKCFGHQRIQMVRAANYATTTGKIAVDGFTAPASTFCDLLAGHALKSRLDCQTPYVVAWAIPLHSVPSKPSATFLSSNIVAQQSARNQPRGLWIKTKVALYGVLYHAAGRELCASILSATRASAAFLPFLLTERSEHSARDRNVRSGFS
jgi:hypothetical protein